jgi:hypothetical protein
MEKFDTLFNILMMNMLFEKTNILNEALQKKSLTLQNALTFAEIVIAQLVEMTVDAKTFNDLFDQSLSLADEYGIVPPTSRFLPGRLRSEQEDKRSQIDPREYYKSIFDKSVDAFVQHLSEKFNTENYKPLIVIVNIFTSQELIESQDLFFDLSIYRDDIDFNATVNEYKVWREFKNKEALSITNMSNVKKIFVEKSLKSVFPNLFTLLSIYLTMPVTSVECERSFSVLKRLKSWLRTTMGQVRLSSLSIIQIHSEAASKLDLNKIVDIFASEGATEGRKCDFI